MSYRDYLNSPPDVVQAMILEALQSIDEKLGHLVDTEAVVLGNSPDAPIFVALASGEPVEAPTPVAEPELEELLQNWRIKYGCGRGPTNADFERIHEVLYRYADPSTGGETMGYYGLELPGAELDPR